MGVVKGFQLACNLAGPHGDLTGRFDQSSGSGSHGFSWTISRLDWNR